MSEWREITTGKGHYRDVAEYVRSCDLCQRYKRSQHAEVGLMDRCEVEEPWSDISADLMEFPQSKSRNKYFDSFRGSVHAMGRSQASSERDRHSGVKGS